MSWNHQICDPCWKLRMMAAGTPWREPTRLLRPELVRCCYCGVMTASGIYVRQDPRTLTCKHPLEA